MSSLIPTLFLSERIMAEVILKNLSKRFGDVVAVNSVDLSIEDKEFMVLVGPSGCGKSTVLRLVAGLENPTKGEIYIGGKLVNEVLPKDRDIAMVFQNYALYPHMSAYENMGFGLKLKKIDKKEIERRVNEAAEILGIKHLLKRKPKELSGGERQRVAVGRAIVRKPVVFLFDEPLSNLDAKLRVQMRFEIKKLHEQVKTTIIYVTHDQIEAMTMGDRIVVMKDGLIQQVGKPLELYRRPQNVFVGGFIGSPSMNFLEGGIIEENFKWFFVKGKFKIQLHDRLTRGLEKVTHKRWTLGVRPEDILLKNHQEGESFDARIDVVEPIGAETLLNVSADSIYLVVKIPETHEFRSGQSVRLVFNHEHLHLFNEHGERVG
jgi:multiple sugar transport system ATP-binding protein